MASYCLEVQNMEIAGVKSRWEMLSILAKHEVWFGYTAEDAKQDWETLREMLGTGTGMKT